MVDLTQKGMKNIVKYSGLKELTPIEQAKLRNIAESEYERIKQSYKNLMDLKIDVRVYGKEKKKYSIHAKIEGPSKIITAEASDWDITKVTRQIITKLKNEVKRQFKEEGKKWQGLKSLIYRFK